MSEPTMKEKFERGLNELISLCVGSDMAPAEMIPALERELKWCQARAANEAE